MRAVEGTGVAAVKLPRTAKGKRPQYFADPATDKLLNMTINLLGEVSVMRDRIDTLERLLEAHGVFPVREVETFRPSQEVEQQRDARREASIRRVLRPTEKELEETVQRKEPAVS